MPLAIPVSNPGTNGSNVRYYIGNLERLPNGHYTDGVYTYDENGLSLDRPDQITPGLPPANQSEDYDIRRPPPQLRPPVQPPGPGAPPGRPAMPQIPGLELALAGGQPPAQQQRVPDAQNPRAVAYANRRLGQLRELGYDFEEMEDPTATWRAASQGVAGAAREAGFLNPRDWLEGRTPRGPDALERAAAAGPRPPGPAQTMQRPPMPSIAGLMARPPAPQVPSAAMQRPQPVPPTALALAFQQRPQRQQRRRLQAA